jgi:zinc-binding in reverse transcriptase
MLAQINYLGCFLTPNRQQMDILYKLITEFVKGRANISKDRIFYNVEHGGLGMIDIKEYIAGQQCAWFKRLLNGCSDTYKDMLLTGGYNRLGCAKPGAFEGSPTLGNICESFEKFYELFLKNNYNWKKSSVLYNPLLKNDRGQCLITEQFLLHNRPPMTGNDIYRLKVGDIWQNNRLLSLDEINELLPEQLSLVSYMRLGQYSRCWDKKTLNKPGTGTLCKSINEFITEFKKGSKPFRTVLNSIVAPKMEKHAETAYRRYIECCGLAGPDGTDKKGHVLSWWRRHFMPNRMRDFLYKMVSNTLNVNARLANYAAHADASCTFCKMNGFLPVERETFAHLFYQCPVVSELHVKVAENYWPELNFANDNEKKNTLATRGIL